MRSDVGFPAGNRGELRTALPADLVAAVLVTVVADAVVLTEPGGAAGLAAAGALLFLLPGYAVVSALYPGGTADGEGAGLGLLERLALSFGVSVAATVFLGLVAYVVGGAGGATGLSTRATLAVVTLVVVTGSAVAAVRRLRRPPGDRYALPYGDWADATRAAVFAGKRSHRLLNVALAVSVLLGVGMLGYGVANPVSGEQYTTASLLTEGEGGDLVANGYPESLDAGESAALVLELGNHEGVETAYTTVVRIERVDAGGGSVTVTEASELDRLSVTVPAGETVTVDHEVAPAMTGERLRLSYYVYRGDAPAEPSASSAYRHLYVWVTVG